MKRVSAGYTVVEVMIFLAVSAALFASATVMLGGREAHTQFSQSMRDVESKMQDWLNDVNTGFSGTNPNLNTCSAAAGSPVINTGGGSPTPQCIFLGKAIHFTTEASVPPSDPEQHRKVFTYQVFGRRLNGDLLVSNLTEARPVAATASNGSGNSDLTDSYEFRGGAKVLSAKSTNPLIDSRMGGFYLSFNTEQSFGLNGALNLKAYQYYINGNSARASNEVTDCIRMAGPGACGSQPAAMDRWDICFGNDRNSDTAVLTFASSGGRGVRVSIVFKECT